MPNNKPVTTVIHHQVQLDQVDKYLDWQKRITEASKKFEGFINTSLIEPGLVTPNENEYVIIFKFENKKLLQNWCDSDERATLLNETSFFSLELPKLQSFTGFEHWFHGPDQNPSRIKMTVISFIAIWPLVHWIPPFTKPILKFSPIINETITTALVTIFMSYLALPLVSKIFKPWLK